MNNTLLLTSALATFSFANAEVKLSQSALDKQFTPNVIEQQDIFGDIHVGYQYTDTAGKHLLVLTGKPIDCAAEVEDLATCYGKIYAYSFIAGDTLTKEWSLNDRIKKTQASEEYAIDFMHDKISLKDLDGDGLVDPIMVYNTTGINKIGDGRIKILTYYKGKKYGVRHQNDTMDSGRGTTVDKSLYTLPKPVKKQVMGIMQELETSEKAIFAWGWKESMQKGKTKLKD